MIAAATQASGISRETWRACWVIVFGAFASGLDASLVTIGLDTMGSHLGADLTTTQWIVTSYLLALALSLPLAAHLSRRLGAGRLWMWALAAFTVASLLCAASPTILLLIAARVLQGLAGGLLIPAGQALLGELVGPEHLGRVMATLGIAVSVAPALGPFVGGLLLAHLPWPWLFLINLPLGAAGLMLGERHLPPGSTQPARRLDLPGLSLTCIALPALLVSLTTWGERGRATPFVVIGAILGVATLTAFVWRSRTIAHPLLSMGLYGLPQYRASSIAATFAGALVFGSGIVHTLYLQMGRRLDTTQAGLALLAIAGATAVMAPATGRWIDRYGAAPVSIAGALLAAATTAPLVVLPLGTPLSVVLPLLVIYGGAVALLAMPTTVGAYKALTLGQLADGVTLVNITQRLGGSLGAALCAVAISARLPDASGGFQSAFAILLLASIGALIGALLMHRLTRTAPRTRV